MAGYFNQSANSSVLGTSPMNTPSLGGLVLPDFSGIFAARDAEARRAREEEQRRYDDAERLKRFMITQELAKADQAKEAARPMQKIQQMTAQAQLDAATNAAPTQMVFGPGVIPGRVQDNQSMSGFQRDIYAPKSVGVAPGGASPAGLSHEGPSAPTYQTDESAPSWLKDRAAGAYLNSTRSPTADEQVQALLAQYLGSGRR